MGLRPLSLGAFLARLSPRGRGQRDALVAVREGLLSHSVPALGLGTGTPESHKLVLAVGFVPSAGCHPEGAAEPRRCPLTPGDSATSLAVLTSEAEPRGDGDSLPGEVLGSGDPPCTHRSSSWVSQAGWWHCGDRMSGPQQLEEKRFGGAWSMPSGQQSALTPPHPGGSSRPPPLSPQGWPCIPSWPGPQARGSRPLGWPPSVPPSLLACPPCQPPWSPALCLEPSHPKTVQ